MDQPKPPLDPSLVKLVYSGMESSAVMEVMFIKYGNVHNPSYHTYVLYYHSLLIHAVRAQRLGLIQMILDHVDFTQVKLEHHMSPVWEALCTDNMTILDYLLSKKISKLTDKVHVILAGQDHFINTLQAVVRSERIDLLLKLLEFHLRESPEEDNYCLHEACTHCSAEFVSKLLVHQDFVRYINKPDRNGLPPLCIAAKHNPDLIPMLLTAGADSTQIISSCNCNTNALSILCTTIGSAKYQWTNYKPVSLIQTLIEHGAQVETEGVGICLLEMCPMPGQFLSQPDGVLDMYQDAMKLISTHSFTSSRKVTLCRIIQNLFYILRMCYVNRTDHYLLNRAISSMVPETQVWYKKVKLLLEDVNKELQDFSSGSWASMAGTILLKHLIDSNTDNRLLFLNDNFIEAYKKCLHIILKAFLAFVSSEDDLSSVEGHLYKLIIVNQDMYLPFLYAYIEKCNISHSVCFVEMLLKRHHEVNFSHELRDELRAKLEELKSLKYITKRCIASHLSGDNYKTNIKLLPLPTTLQDYLLQ